MKTAIEKPVTPGGVFDHLMVPQGDEPEFHPSKDPKTMTVQESLEEVDRFLCWNRMTPEEKRAEQEAQRAASHATEQAAGDIPCTMRPERMPDTPQDTVWEDLTDAPQDVVRADVLDTSMGGMLEAVPSNGAPERAADTMPDDVPDATEGNVPGREADTVPDGPPDDLQDTVEGNMPDVVGALTAQEKAGNETVQGVPEVEVVPPEAIVPLGQIGEDVPAAEERWAYASELIGDAFQHWGNGRVLLDMGTGRGKSEFVIRKMAGWAVDQFLEGNCDNRILMLCPLTLLHEDLENRRREEYLTVFGDASEEEWDLYEEVLTVITYQKLEQLCKGDASDHRSLQKLLDRHRIIIADECHYWSEFSAFNINTHYSFDTLLQAEKNHTVIYMSATGRDTWKLLEEKGGPTQLERIYRLPQHYEYVKAAYFYARHNLVTIMFVAWMPVFENILPMLQVLFVSVGQAKLIAFRNFWVSCARLAVVAVACFITKEVRTIFAVLLVLDILQVIIFKKQLSDRGYGVDLKKFSAKLAPEILKFCIPMAVFVLVNSLNRDIDKYVIAFFTDTETLGIYSNAARLLPFDMITASFITVLAPIFTRQVKAEDNSKALDTLKIFIRVCYMDFRCGCNSKCTRANALSL